MESKPLGEVCRLADAFKDNPARLRELWNEVKDNKVYYTDSDYGFMKEHIKIYADEIMADEKVKKLTDDF